MRVEVRYARSGDVEIAYQTLGLGPPTLVLVAGAVTNLDVLWQQSDYRRFCEQLASFCRLVLFDKRGMGLSDRVNCSSATTTSYGGSSPASAAARSTRPGTAAARGS